MAAKNLADELRGQFPELAQSFKGDTVLLNVKDVNETDQFGIGGVDDVVLYLLTALPATLKQQVEAYIRNKRPTAQRVIFSY